MTIRKTLALAALLGGMLAAVGTSPAAAGGGPADYAACVITIDPATFAPGGTVVVTGSGLQPDYDTPILLDDEQIASVRTDATGAFTTQVTVPDDLAPGTHTLTAECDAQGNVSTTDVTITTSGSEPPGGTDGVGSPLPRTGSDSTEPLVVFGGIAVLAGAAFMLAGRRRRSAHVDV